MQSNAELFGELGERRDELAESIQILPTFLDESRKTLARLRTFSLDTEPLLRDLDPVLDDLQPTLASLGALSPDLTNLFENIDPLIDAGEDGLPALSRTLRGLDPTLKSAGPFLRQLNPILRFLELNQVKVADFMAVPPSVLGGIRSTVPGSKSNGHVLPQIIIAGEQTLPAPLAHARQPRQRLPAPRRPPRRVLAGAAELRLQAHGREAAEQHAGLQGLRTDPVRRRHTALPERARGRARRRPALMTRVGVVGHVELVEFARVARVPLPGEIVHAGAFFTEPAGGGAVAAVQLRRLAGEALFLTAVGTGVDGDRTAAELRERHGVTVHAARRPGPQRRTFTFLDDAGERTITVLGERTVPHRDDPLPWEALGDLDAVYLTGGDAAAVRAARAARVLVATPRAMRALEGSGVRLDVLVGSADDSGEAYVTGSLQPRPRVVVRTRGALGGSWELDEPGAELEPVAWLPAGERAGSWRATALPGPAVDAYGCGDSFAAALAYGLGAGMVLDAAIELAARCGAACLTGRGPYEAQLSR